MTLSAEIKLAVSSVATSPRGGIVVLSMMVSGSGEPVEHRARPARSSPQTAGNGATEADADFGDIGKAKNRALPRAHDRGSLPHWYLFCGRAIHDDPAWSRFPQLKLSLFFGGIVRNDVEYTSVLLSTTEY